MGTTRIWIAIAACALSYLSGPPPVTARSEPTVDELKARVGSTNIPDRPPLCIRISERQLEEAEKRYASGDIDKAKASLTDVAAFAELARDYSIQAHKHEKQAEIALRKMTRKLTDLKHTVSHDDQPDVQATIDRLQKVRDDLLAAMFPKGSKK